MAAIRNVALRGLFALAATATVAPAASAADTPALPPLLQHAFSAVSLSPDGRRLADIETDDPADPSVQDTMRLVIRDTASGARTVVALPCGDVPDCKPGQPVWRPDGQGLVFLLQDKTKPTHPAQATSATGPAPTPGWRIEAVDADGSHPRLLLAFAGTLDRPRFAPDGRLAVLAIADAHKEIGAASAAAALSGEIGAHEDEQRIGILNGTSLELVSPPDLFVYEYEWSRDGRGFVGTAAPGNGDQNWYVAKLLAFPAAGGTPRVLFAPRSYQQQIADPVVSPDGRNVAFIVGVMSDFGSTGGDVWSAPLDGGTAARNLTAGSRRSFAGLNWSCGPSLLASDIKGPRTGLVRLDATGHETSLWSDEARLSSEGYNPSVACAGDTTAGIVTTMTRPAVLVAGPVGQWHPISHENDQVVARWTARSVSWSDGGVTPSGWLLQPLHPGPGRRPMVVEVHGGPSAAAMPNFPRRGFPLDMLDAGYDLFMPNPRGSFGEGEAFAAADVRDLGAGPLRDILAGVDAVEKLAPIDDRRLGLFGYSYGGYMALWAATQTDRFKAIVSGAGISDWISLDGSTGVEKADLALFGAPSYAALPLYLSQSPIAHVRSVHTPVFLFGGDHDDECPIGQSLEFWHDLRDLGRPTQFVVYPGQGHGMQDAHDWNDATRRTVAWFDHYVGAGGGK